VLLVCGKEITDSFEEKLAWFFMHYGRWENFKQNTSVSKSLVIKS